MRTTIILAGLLLAPAPVLAQATPPAPPPAGAAPIDLAQLAAATSVVAALVPEGIYMRMMRDKFPVMMDQMMGQMSGMTGAALGFGGDGKTLGETARSADPAFDERLRIMSRVMGEELGSVLTKVEPKLRIGLAKSFARRFTLVQLGDLNAFFATPSGRAFASEYLLTFMDPEVLQEMLSATPEIIKAMPAMMKRVEAETAHLPKPPTPGARK